MAVNDPTQPDVSSFLVAQLAPLAQQAAQQAVGTLQSDLAQVQADVAENRASIEAAVAKAGQSVLTNVENDPMTQRIVVCAVVGALLVAGLMILGFALLGNATANRWIAGAPLALGAAVLWVSKAGVSLTKPAVKA